VPSPACSVLDSYGANTVERTLGPYLSQYASSSLTQCGRLMAPVSQRLRFGCEAVVTPNSARRISAHASMSCPACSRAARSRSRSASPQATSAPGRPDTIIVSHTHIQGVYASRSYYTYVTYWPWPNTLSLNCRDGSPRDLGVTPAPERHMRTTLPARHPGPLHAALSPGATYHVACLHNTGQGQVPLEQLHCNFVLDMSTNSLNFHRMLAMS
jgi:hypothetical protein